ncbi:ISAs1 family transposase [Candidatus Fukatsuia endosymbiont of Tuberolachnus salignus]|uniref:ISAs1 family transposase n=1 Tax=Candidatus Fukatsuia endosymbiont of Tuberolachnus salignus TaxID=3077957 RepID=UPI00313C68CC
MSLFKQLALIPDRRKDINIKHPLIDVIFLVFAAVLSGASGWKSIQDFGEAQLDWLKKYGTYQSGIPRRRCIANIINALKTYLLVQTLLSWINERRERAGRTLIALDGKTLRRTWSEEICTALHTVSAYDVDVGITLYQKAANSQGKEGELARQIIDALALDNAIVTLDSLNLFGNSHLSNFHVIAVRYNFDYILNTIQYKYMTRLIFML